jgi:hypothetical protein
VFCGLKEPGCFDKKEKKKDKDFGCIYREGT